MQSDYHLLQNSTRIDKVSFRTETFKYYVLSSSSAVRWNFLHIFARHRTANFVFPWWQRPFSKILYVYKLEHCCPSWSPCLLMPLLLRSRHPYTGSSTSLCRSNPMGYSLCFSSERSLSQHQIILFSLKRQEVLHHNWLNMYSPAD